MRPTSPADRVLAIQIDPEMELVLIPAIWAINTHPAGAYMFVSGLGKRDSGLAQDVGDTGHIFWMRLKISLDSLEWSE